MSSTRSRFLVCRPMVRTGLLILMLALLLPAVLAAPPAAPSTAAPAPARSDPIVLDKKIITEAQNGSAIMANLTYLSDIIGPRLTGSAALKKANDWTAEKMRSYGLSNVHLEGWTIPVGWQRGTASLRIVEPNNGRSLTVAAMGWTPGTKGRITGEVVVLNARSSADLAPYKGKLKNAVILRGPPAVIRPITERGSGVDRPRRSTTEAKGDKKPDAKTDAPPPRRRPRGYPSPEFRRELAEFLRKEGVAVVLMDAGKPHGLLNMTGAWRGDDRVSGAEPLPSLFVTHEHYAMLHRLATRPAPARTRVEVEVDNQFIPGPVAVYNTVGEIRGAERPDEFVVLGAHLDSWDLGQGTTDNGTGSCVVLEAARVLAKSGVRPRRTIRFVLFTGEEQGLHGSKEYVKRHKDEMAKTSMALVHDTGTGRVVGIGLQGRAAIKPILEKELVTLKELGVTDIDLRGMGGTDHLSFEKADVPGFAVRQDPAEYRFTHHSQSDTLDKAREPDLIQGVQVMAVAAVRIANLPQLLPRDKPAKEKPRRETPPVKPSAEKK
ncbi:MAG TPA: M20/M25/M40 family metallo-hydrolase [Gemmataceae bacterium]|nr:M20/M25/M40 family metallo-hydrolase [Gemmataceae bacterium]